MFGFSLKDKAKKILENDIGHFNPTNSWLNHIIKQGNSQDFNEYDVVINYLMTDWEFKINEVLNRPDAFKKEIRKSWYKSINSEMKKFKLIEHKAHQDLDFRDRCKDLIKKSKFLNK
ncbi:hypothetical protein OAM08_00225 [Pelagibacteraceae bacterium]|nr:hypothetical protein [Pelagibacteraceae bacterium]